MKYLAGLLLVLLVGCGRGINSGKGQKIGQIVKIAEHGMICTTWEGEIIRGGFNGGSGVNGTVLDFTILDRGLYERLKTAMEQQQEIELFYDKASLTGPCTSETSVFATDFRVLSAPNRIDAGKEAEKNELLKKLRALEQ